MSVGYGSHTTLLTAAFSVTTGSVLELGSGLGSTPVLHGLCGSHDRKLTTIESDGDWMETLKDYHRSWHTFRHVKNFVNLPEYKDKWGLAFVDHGFMHQRAHSIVSLKNVPLIVVHDTCTPEIYGYYEAFTHFKYRWDLRLFGPRTSVISNHIQVDKIFGRFDL